MEKEETKPNNPFAFPYSDGLNGYMQDGMTLRDYFAAKAMQSMLSNSSMYRFLSIVAFREISKYSYEISDEMLKQRENENN